MTAAAQVSHRVALTSKLRFEEQIQQRKLKNIASILSNAILQFWSSVEVPPGELDASRSGIDKVSVDHMVLFLSVKSELRIYKYTATCWIK